MSFSITPTENIRNHPVNNSTSKQIHMFSKQKRFIVPNPQCPNAFYSFDSQLSNRKAAFGFGDKSDFTKTLTSSPPVTRYEIKTFLDESKTKGKSFGLDREKLPDNSYLIPQIHKHPSPSSYDNQKAKKNDYSFTMRPKPVDFIDKKLTYKQSPGPAAHQEVDLFPKTGRLTVSKFTDAQFSVIHPRTPRFATIKQTPGPSSYIEGDSINGSSKYVLSQRKSNGRRLFSKTARDVYWRKSETPGPGSYVQTTQFGHYGNSGYYKTLGK